MSHQIRSGEDQLIYTYWRSLPEPGRIWFEVPIPIDRDGFESAEHRRLDAVICPGDAASIQDSLPPWDELKDEDIVVVEAKKRPDDTLIGQVMAGRVEVARRMGRPVEEVGAVALTQSGLGYRKRVCERLGIEAEQVHPCALVAVPFDVEEDVEILEWLDGLAHEHGVDRAEAIRRILADAHRTAAARD